LNYFMHLNPLLYRLTHNIECVSLSSCKSKSIYYHAVGMWTIFDNETMASFTQYRRARNIPRAVPTRSKNGFCLKRTTIRSRV